MGGGSRVGAPNESGALGEGVQEDAALAADAHLRRPAHAQEEGLGAWVPATLLLAHVAALQTDSRVPTVPEE